MVQASSTKQFQNVFSGYLTTTQKHLIKLGQLFELMDTKAVAKRCEAMAGLVTECYNVIEQSEKGSHIRNAGLIIAAQKIAHYQIATYGGLVQLSTVLGDEELTDLLKSSLTAQKEMSELFTSLAEGGTYADAAAEGIISNTPVQKFASVNLKKMPVTK